MGELVELDVTTVEESVTVNVTAEGAVQISVVAETGPAGPAGPNSVTSATTSDFTNGHVLASTGTNVTSIATSFGGNGNNDENKLAKFDGSGVLNAAAFQVRDTDGTILGAFSAVEIAMKNNAVDGDIVITATTTAGTTRSYNLPDASGTVALTDDPRFTDARTPLAHTHVVSDIVSIASQHLIGRHAGGTGAGQAVDVGNGLEFQGSGIRRSALTGDITASAGSNATTLAATIAGDKTFSGALSLTSTTRPTSAGTGTLAATSLITLNDNANEFLRKVNKYSEHEIYTFTTAILTTIGGTAGSSVSTGGGDAPAWVYRPSGIVASANNYQALIGAYLQLSNGSNRSIKNWSKRSSLSLRHLHISSGGTIRYYWGPQASTWTGGALAVRGIGFEIINNTVFATCHNGTTKTTAATGVAFSNQIFYSLHIESDGLGGVRWWVDNVEQTPLTGGPTGNSGTSQYGFCTEAINPDPAAGTFVNIHYLRLATVN